MVLKTSKKIIGAPNSIGVWSVDQAASKASKAWKLLFEPFSNVQAGCWPSHSMHIYIFIVHQDHSPCPYVRHWMLCGWLKGRKMSFPGPFVFFPFWMQWQDLLWKSCIYMYAGHPCLRNCRRPSRETGKDSL